MYACTQLDVLYIIEVDILHCQEFLSIFFCYYAWVLSLLSYKEAGGHKEMSSILADLKYIGGWGGGGAGSQPMSTAVHMEFK